MIVEGSMRTGSASDTTVALVTGASGGIGRVIALGLARQGYTVGLHHASHQAETLALAADIAREGGRAATFRADLREASEVTTLLANVEAELGAPTCLVHTATPPIRPAPALHVTQEAFFEHFAVQALSMAQLCRGVLPAMQRRQHGVILGLLSTVLESPRPKRWWSYTTGKFALAGILAGLATDVEGSGVRVVGLMPSGVATDLSRCAGAGDGELLQPTTVAAAALRLILEPAKFPNGSLVRLQPSGGELGRMAFSGKPLENFVENAQNDRVVREVR